MNNISLVALHVAVTLIVELSICIIRRDVRTISSGKCTIARNITSFSSQKEQAYCFSGGYFSYSRS
jgi:hypothetical protein